jgi:hypothetical protein
MWRLRSQGVELLGGAKAFCPVLLNQLTFPQHVHELDACQRTLSRVK